MEYAVNRYESRKDFPKEGDNFCLYCTTGDVYIYKDNEYLLLTLANEHTTDDDIVSNLVDSKCNNVDKDTTNKYLTSKRYTNEYPSYDTIVKIKKD